MSAVLFATFKMTFGLFVNKARSASSENLKDGDVNSQELRDLIATNMENVNARIDRLVHRELLSSAILIKEGLFVLNDIIDKPKKFQRVSQKLGRVHDCVVRCKSWLTKSDANEAKTTNVNSSYFDFDMNSTRKRVEAVSELRMSSPDHFKSAMKCFDKAYARATNQFFDESLSIQERVMAAKLRVQSRLLLSLQNPSLANVCKEVYLKELHDLPAIKESFRYDFEGGMLTILERRDIVLSVSMINFVLFQFLSRFSGELVNVYDWPQMEGGDWMYNPLIPDETIFTELERAEVEVPALMSLKPLQSEILGWHPKLVAINTHGDLILFRQRTNPETCELLKISGGEVSVFCTFAEFTPVSFLAIDRNDAVYVFVDLQSNAPPGFVVYDVIMFNPCGNLQKVYKRFLLLDGSMILAPTPAECEVALCIPNEVIPPEKEIGAKNDILAEEKIQGGENNQSEEKIPTEWNSPNDKKIQGGADIPNGEQIQGAEDVIDSILVEIEMWKSTLATITDNNEVVAVKQSGYKLDVYERYSELELRGGKREACLGLTFNSLTKELVVVSRLGGKYFLSTYEVLSGERRHYVILSHIGEDCEEIQLTSHCS